MMPEDEGDPGLGRGGRQRGQKLTCQALLGSLIRPRSKSTDRAVRWIHSEKVF